MATALSIIGLLLLVWLPLAVAVVGQPSGFDIHQVSMTEWLTPTLLTLALTVTTTMVGIGIALHLAQRIGGAIQSRLSVVLSMPHVAFAVGVMLLFSPTGLLVRLIETITGWLPVPPVDWPLPEKSMVTLTLVLLAKEIPFLLLMIATQLQQLPYQRWLMQAQSLGWSRTRSWWLIVVPALLPRLMLPLAAVIIYTVSVVDIPLMLGPNTPGVLAMHIHESYFNWQQQALSLALVLLVACGFAVILLTKVAQAYYAKVCQGLRRRLTKSSGWQRPPLLSSRVLVAVALLAIAGIVLQSMAGAWFYPQLWPQQWQPQRWLQEWPYAWPLLWDTAWLAATSAAIGLFGAIAVLERQRQQGEKQLKLGPLLLLLLPQLLLVIGWQRVLGQGSEGALLLWSHAVFCFPYAYLVMHGAWVNFDERWLYQAQSLGYSSAQAFWKLLVPMLRTPLMMGYAMAFSVSIAQYLPTQWLAGGTVPTLTTEAVSIASGGDWRLASVYAVLQTLLPLTVFILLMRRRHYVAA